MGFEFRGLKRRQAIAEQMLIAAMRKLARRRRCRGCWVNWADPPSQLCPGCQAYREHQA